MLPSTKLSSPSVDADSKLIYFLIFPVSSCLGSATQSQTLYVFDVLNGAQTL